ncbi:hypothetical protein CHGG_06232 [Chaetomium globosum CBS 148.51]|uniref:Uncharacterized protein n=1 Tax=Chaetomium globosum (strain ATCC 6205 / CBS 148.51 / DSM 1962 / NBRC 6347 / NRRL 1970) TaxID=306901 RepID=Q2H533_CHAGB|nr:uncharacterized protein CHGG_06232 [Chaetomium globosum CBS 148.51]EAQ89613.1 hypothetical protein CHGG_06232 [Chaetomium globosum CBS 148.51]
MLSPSAWPTALSTKPSYSSSCELDASKLMVDRSFPELLARDLTTSENIFKSKAMTAGCPFAGLAAPDLVTSASFQRPLLPPRAGHQQQPPGVDKSLLRPFVIEEEEGLYVEDLDGDERFGMKDSYLDSSNVHSTGMVPHLILARQQSVATAATSDSGRCSSVFSHNAHSPTFPVLSSCSSNREGSSHGTWYEDDPGSPQNGPASSVFTARTSISDPRQPALDIGNYDDMIEPSTPTDDPKGFAQATAETHSPGGSHGTHPRPSTPIRQPHPEKARIVDIPPLSTGLKWASSRKWDRHRPGSPSVASLSREMTVPVGVTEEHRQSERIPGNTRPNVPLLETANGRTVIDASAPPPIAFASRDQALHRFNARPLSSMAIDENEIFDDGEEPSAMAYAEALSKAKKPSLPDLRRWVEATSETFAASQKSTSYTPSAPGIPLPPEVIESLRVSIACFPETMLLTSSLSIETIRATLSIPHKAATLLGMDDPISAAAPYSKPSPSPSPSRRGVLSRGRRDKFPLNDLFATSAPVAAGSGGGGGGGGGGYGLSRSGTVGGGRARSGTGGSSRSGTSHGFRGGGGGGVCQEGGGGGAALLAGLGRCVSMLVATMRKEGGEGGDAGWGVILENGEGSVEGVDGLDSGVDEGHL